MAVDDPSHPPETPAKPRVPWLSFAALVIGVAWLVANGFLVAVLILAGAFVLVAFASGFLVALGRTRKTYWMAPRPEIRPIEPDDPAFPPGFADRHVEAADRLAGLGFAPRGMYAVDKANSVASSRVAIFEDRAGRTVARWLVLVTPRKAIGPILAYVTRFADGSEVVTSNNPVPALTPPLPSRRGFTFPTVADPDRLLSLHRRALAELGEFSSREEVPLGDPAAYLRGVIDADVAHQVGLGYFRLEEATGLYRLSRKGASLMALRRIWPWGPIRRAIRRGRDAARLRRWEG